MLTDYQKKCAKEGKFVEAELTKKRIAQLKDVQDKKMLEGVKERQEKERLNLEKSQKDELNKYNTGKDEELYEISSKFQEQQQQLKMKHKKEENEKRDLFEKGYPKNVKPSNELINLNKKLELYAKKEE